MKDFLDKAGTLLPKGLAILLSIVFILALLGVFG